ncbi:hypothetical protein C8P64_2117 [Christiangramia gaetbulicola]|uniref:Uncharacterized protein n=1 Tax=Christiangramia gaetbulicola TaxID=703340 RepID=A0A2T6AID7_9FLAO|nr:hypothetical protein [Christiangramia gaetbulicola]PTX43588.1 hypothetical protein C8P64_2117 [Christiangramia gaetbulicola]
MSTFNNPFSIDRAEHLGDQLFEFFAFHRRFDGLLKHKSLLLEGGRGSGKTMFFLYNSYFIQKKEAQKKNNFPEGFLESKKIIGIYYRSDSNFVPAFQHKGIDGSEWMSLFSTYLNLEISKRLLEIIIDVDTNFNIASLRIGQQAQKILGIDSIPANYKELNEKIKIAEIELISYINNPNTGLKKPHIISNGYLINMLAIEFLKNDLIKNKTIHVFIDEFENMLPYQQKIINTLIKHPSPVIFDVGMRKEGLYTNETLSGNEIIKYPDDYSHFDLEKFKREDYEKFLVEICKKRLSQVVELKGKDDIYIDINFYLKNHSDEEIDALSKKSNLNKLKIKLSHRLEHGDGEKFQPLLEENDIVIVRLFLILIERGLSGAEILDEYIKFKKKEDSKFKEWIHNNKNGIIFLLTKEFKREKDYSGFKTFQMLSSGIIRYFIELCETAFNNAHRNNFNFQSPRALSSAEQTDAANYVSEYKFNALDTYSPYSTKLKRFVTFLGKIFERLHRDPRMSEPERNHFTTQYDGLSEESKKFLNSAVLHSVLQKKKETKNKSNSIDANYLEFHLNHIYSPYFQISPRTIRSLRINSKNLESLILEQDEKAKSVANAIVKGRDGGTNQLQIDLK